MVRIVDLIKNTNKIHPHETLSSAVSKLSSSHDAGFIFSEENEFKGLISPYYCLIKSSYPANTRVERCLYHAPHVKINYPISKVAELMIESKVHYLPVFDEQDKFIGIISARRLLSTLKGLPLFKIKIKELLRSKKNSLVTILQNEFISTALSEFKKYKVSKLVVVNKDKKLQGVLSYYDLISFLIAPKNKEHLGDRSGNKVSLNHRQVKNFTKTFILTLSLEDSMEEALRLILEKKIGSVVIVDQLRHPIGIITTKDFLTLLANERGGEKLEIISKNLSQENRQVVGGFFYYINSWVKKIPDVVRARLFVKEEKQGEFFKANLALFPKKGNPKIIEEEGKNLVEVLKKIKKD